MSASWPNEGQLTTARCPDPILSAQLSATALRLAAARVPVDAAGEELCGIADRRGDPLAKRAGLMIDAAAVRPVSAEYRAAVRLLIAAPAPRRTSSRGWVEIGRRRGLNRSPAF